MIGMEGICSCRTRRSRGNRTFSLHFIACFVVFLIGKLERILSISRQAESRRYALLLYSNLYSRNGHACPFPQAKGHRDTLGCSKLPDAHARCLGAPVRIAKGQKTTGVVH